VTKVFEVGGQQMAKVQRFTDSYRTVLAPITYTPSEWWVVSNTKGGLNEIGFVVKTPGLWQDKNPGAGAASTDAKQISGTRKRVELDSTAAYNALSAQDKTTCGNNQNLGNKSPTCCQDKNDGNKWKLMDTCDYVQYQAHVLEFTGGMSDTFTEMNAFGGSGPWKNHQAINCNCKLKANRNQAATIIDTCYVHHKEVGGYPYPSIEFPFDYSPDTEYVCSFPLKNPAANFKYRLVLKESYRPAYPNYYYQSAEQTVTGKTPHTPPLTFPVYNYAASKQGTLACNNYGTKNSPTVPQQ
jgi:hypothetical protein